MQYQPSPEGRAVFSHLTEQEARGILRRHMGQSLKLTLVWEHPGQTESHVYDLSTPFARRNRRGLGLWMNKADKVILDS